MASTQSKKLELQTFPQTAMHGNVQHGAADIAILFVWTNLPFGKAISLIFQTFPQIARCGNIQAAATVLANCLHGLYLQLGQASLTFKTFLFSCSTKVVYCPLLSITTTVLAKYSNLSHTIPSFATGFKCC
jgi:hypothetical protein